MIPRFDDYAQHVQEMIDAALTAADPANAVRRNLQKNGRLLNVGGFQYRLDSGRVFLIAVGKAALKMGKAALERLEGEISAGVIITKQTEPGIPRRYDASVGHHSAQVAVFEAAHPISDESSLRASSYVVEMLEQTQPNDLVLCLISGGASALLSQPYLPLAQWQHLNRALLESGCTINELNCVRKQLDRLKGGGLVELAAPAATISLILSDVVGNPLDIIGSGPTAPNPQSPAEALSILHRYNIDRVVAPDTWTRITQRLTDPRAATSVSRFNQFEAHNVIIGDVGTATKAACARAEQLGFEAQVLTKQLEGEAREVGRVAAALAKDAPPGRCLILGGETTVTVRGDGAGGRNQEVALAAAIALAGYEKRAFCSVATDGEDGPTPAAGALVTGRTVPIALSASLNPQAFLDRNDSFGFFQRLGEEHGEHCLLHLGPTGTNVNDLLLILSYT